MAMNDKRSLYEKIIHLPHKQSTRHPPMSMQARAAQFAPFSALNGYDDAIKESAHQTNDKIELSDDDWERLEQKIQWLYHHVDEQIRTDITYFETDLRKQGSRAVTVSGIIKKMDLYKRRITFENGTTLSIDRILSIESNRFDELSLYFDSP